MPYSNQIDDYTDADYQLIISDPDKIGFRRNCKGCGQDHAVLFEVVNRGELYCYDCLVSICNVTVL